MANSTDPTDSENVAGALIVGLLSVAACIGNGIVVLSYFTCSNLRDQPGNCFVLNLALTDFLCAVYTQMPCIANLANPEMRFTGVFCDLQAMLNWTLRTASNWSLAAISIDRAIAINKPFQYRIWLTNFRTRVAVACIWVLSIIISFTVDRDNPYNQYEYMCTPQFKENFVSFGYFMSILCFWIPTTILISSNVSIIYIVKRLQSVVVDSSSEVNETERPHFIVKAHTKTLRSLYVLVVVYMLCVTPYYFAKFSFVHKKGGYLPNSMLVLTIILLFLASALNPFIYAILRQDYRQAMKNFLSMLSNKIKRIKIHIFGEQKNIT